MRRDRIVRLGAMAAGLLVVGGGLTFAVSAGAGERPATSRAVKLSLLTPDNPDATYGNPRDAVLSRDGRFAAFVAATTVGTGDARRSISSVYIRDLSTGRTRQAPVQAGPQRIRFSANGRYLVAFGHDIDTSKVPAGMFWRPIVIDVERNTLRSIVPAVGQVVYSADVTDDGRYVVYAADYQQTVFPADKNGERDIYRWDTVTETNLLVSRTVAAESDAGSVTPQISRDGRFVTFASEATNLVPGDTNNGYGQYDIFRRDLDSGDVKRLSVATGNVQQRGTSTYPRTTPDGRWTVFHSTADLAGQGSGPGIFVHDADTGSTTAVPRPAGIPGYFPRYAAYPDLSSDGQTVVYHWTAEKCPAGGGTHCDVIIVHDRRTGTDTPIGAGHVRANAITGQPAYEPYISGDARTVVFTAQGAALPEDQDGEGWDVYLAELS